MNALDCSIVWGLAGALLGIGLGFDLGEPGVFGGLAVGAVAGAFLGRVLFWPLRAFQGALPYGFPIRVGSLIGMLALASAGWFVSWAFMLAGSIAGALLGAVVVELLRASNEGESLHADE